jgi:hypothetical protein
MGLPRFGSIQQMTYPLSDRAADLCSGVRQAVLAEAVHAVQLNSEFQPTPQPGPDLWPRKCHTLVRTVHDTVHHQNQRSVACTQKWPTSLRYLIDLGCSAIKYTIFTCARCKSNDDSHSESGLNKAQGQTSVVCHGLLG